MAARTKLIEQVDELKLGITSYEFQAKETLKSIIENYRGPDLSEIAADKLNALENANTPESQGDTL